MKGKVLQKLVASILVFCLTSINFILVGTSAVYALSNNNVTDKNTNIIFDAYFKDGEKTTHEKYGQISEGETLYLSIDMSKVKESGILKGAKVKIDNANFTIENVNNNPYVNYINTQNNEIVLVDEINSSVGVIEINLPIKFQKSDIISTNYFSMENNVVLSGKYKDSSDNDKTINMQIDTKLNWMESNVKVLYNQDENGEKISSIEKYLIEDGKILVQYKVESTVENNKLPKEKETLKLTAPKIDEKLPSKVYVLFNGTKLSDETILNNYDLKEGTLEFSVDFIKDNNITWKTGKDEYKIIYIYEQDVTEGEKEINISTDIETKIYGHENTLKGNVKESIQSDGVTKGTTVSITGTADPNDIYKGYMYSNTEATQYIENYKVEISDKENINNINVEFVEDKFKTSDGTEKETNSATEYEQIKISKENMLNILGDDGAITIINDNEETQTITKDSSVNDEGEIEVNLLTHDITIKTSKPVQEGTLEITAVKQIKGNAGYSREELKTINSIKTKMQVTTDKNEEIADVEIEKELKETTTEATLEMNNENKGQILSTISQNNVEFIATLKAGTMETDLYKEPTVKIILPAEVTKITEINVNALYAEKELEIEKISEGINNDGRKTIEVKLKGEQVEYNNKVQDGIKLTIGAKIELDELAITKDSKVETIYTNENSVEQQKSTSIDVKIQSPIDGVILRNELTVDGGETEKTFEEKLLSKELNVNDNSKIANVNMAIVNNHDQAIDNLVIIGRIPTEESKATIFENSLTSTFKANLQNGIQTNGNIAQILYSEDENADKNSDWTAASFENAKSFKIEVTDNKLEVGEKLQISYNIVIPEGLSYNESTYTKLDISYNYKGQQQTKTAADYLYTKFKSSNEVLQEAEGKTETLDGIDVKIVAISNGQEVKEGDSVVEGQTIKYVLTVANKTGKDLNNLNVEVNHENANIYDEYVYQEPDSFNTSEMKDFTTIIEKEGLSNKTFEIGTLKNEETKNIEYQIAVKENVENINGNIKITAEGLEEKNIQISNPVSEGELKLSFTNNVAREHPLIKDNIFTNILEIKNISEEKKENVDVEFNIPEGLELYGIKENDEYEIVKQDKNFLKLRVKEILSNSTKTIYIELKVAEEPKVNSVNTQCIAKLNEKTYCSNELEVLLEKTYKSSIEVSQTANIDGDSVKTGDKLTYVISIRNNGEKEEQLEIQDQVPQAAVIKNAYYAKENEENEEVEYTEYNNLIDVKYLSAGEEIKLYIETQINEENATEATITNIVKVQGYSATVESNEITYKLENYKEEPGNETNPGEGEINPGEGEINPGEGETNPDEGENPGGNSTITIKNSISGLVWVDENKNGIRETSEKALEGIVVSLANVETGKYITDSNGNKIEKTTGKDGRYVFEDMEEGKYIVVFKYDDIKYRNTEYKAKDATETTNSDVITSKVSINDETIKYAVTDTLELKDKSLENIDAGFIENEIFDLTLNKYVSKVTVQNSAGTVVKQYNKEQLAKVEIDAKVVAGSTVLIEYEIQVKNEGELAGYANEIVDYIPKDLSFSSEINPDWYISTDGNLHTTVLSKQLIEPGKTINLKLTLVKTMTDNNIGRTLNKAEIAKSSNELSIPDKDSVAGNNVQGEDDISTAEVIISIRTGVALAIGTIVAIIALTAGGIIVYTIRRKEAKHEE